MSSGAKGQMHAAAFAGGRDRPAAVAVATLPGATLWHHGQFEDRRAHLPVFLGRRPDEPVDEDLRGFYHRLVGFAGGLRRGDWTALHCHGWPDNPTHHDLQAWAWHGEVPHHVVMVNLSRASVPGPDPVAIVTGWPVAAASEACPRTGTTPSRAG